MNQAGMLLELIWVVTRQASAELISAILGNGWIEQGEWLYTFRREDGQKGYGLCLTPQEECIYLW